MPARVEFFSAPYSRPNRHFPIGALTKYLVHSEMLMKTSPDMEQIVNVPEFPDWDIVNLVRITDTSYVYWVKASYKRTDLKGQVTFELLFNPITSLISEGDTLKGAWDRLPTNECPYLKEIINTDAMKIIRSTDIDKLPTVQGFQVCWYEIAMRQEITQSEPETLIRYGGFATIPTSSSNGYYDAWLIANGKKSTGSKMYAYPSLNIIMNNFRKISPTATTDKVISINVSLRCPFKYRLNTTGEIKMDILAGNTELEPAIFSEYDENDIVTWVLYPLEKLDGMPTKYEKIQAFNCSETERKYGSFNLVDESGMTIGEIPSEYFVGNSLNVKITCSSDYTGIYTNLEFNGGLIRVPEGKLPWVGDSWTDYQVRSMDSDRASMELSIQTAKDQRNIDAMTTMSNTAMSAVMGFAMNGPAAAIGLGVATAATGIVGAEMQGRLSERTARSEQEINEKNQKQQLSNYFDTAYGLIYLLDYSERALRLTVSMPMNLTMPMVNTYVDEYGYRTEGIRSVTVQDGRYQGRLIEIPISGPKGDLLNAEFIEGVHLTMEDGS